MRKIIEFRRNLIALAVAGLVLSFHGCETLVSPNENFGDLDDLVNNPTPGGINSAIAGLLITYRGSIAFAANDFVGQLGLLGRESYTLDINDPRFETEMLGGPLNSASAAFGGNHWNEPYSNLRLGDIILKGVDELDDALY